MSYDALRDSIRDYEAYFREYDSWIEESVRDALAGLQECSGFLASITRESQERERTLRDVFGFDPASGNRPDGVPDPKITDVHTANGFFRTCVEWMNLDGALRFSQMVFEDEKLETTAENRIKFAALAALAWLCGHHARFMWLLEAPFEETATDAVAALSGRTATTISLQHLRDVLGREGQDLAEQLPPAILDALGDGDRFSELANSVTLEALKRALEGKPPTSGHDAVSAAIRSAVDLDLRARDRVFRQRGRKEESKEVSLPETEATAPKTAGEDFQLREYASRLEVTEELRSFVERARMVLTAGEMSVLDLLVADPALKGTDIAAALGISPAAVSIHRKNLRGKLEQAGLKDRLFEHLG